MDKKYYVHTIDTFTNKDVRVEVSKEVYQTIKKSERKERYFSDDLKKERIEVNQCDQTIKIVKSREDSFERLTEEAFKEFPDRYSLEDDCENKLLLIDALYQLEETDLKMIYCLYYKDLTEREYARKNNIRQSTVNYRKNKVLRKLKKHFQLD